MLKPALLMLLLFFSGAMARHFHTTSTEQAHRQWLEERYAEATSIKEGMTRADVLKLFETDGGLQRLGVPERYVLKSCSMIKVDIEFDPPAGIKGELLEPAEGVRVGGAQPSERKRQIVPDTALKVKRVSRPYLEHFITD